MPKSIFLFDGGNYKRGVDSGRLRTPLTPQEAEMVFYDPELPGDSDNTIGTELNMVKYASDLCELAVGDEIFVGVVPDAAWYRGLWMMSFDSLPGFEVNLDLVSVADVYQAWLDNDGDATGVAAFNTPAGQLQYDFANGLGDATKDACDQVALYGGQESDYRNNAALVSSPFASTLAAGLGQALYFRLTITAVPGEFEPGADCCNTCGDGDRLPTFQVGAVYDRLCADKQRTRVYCNCPDQLCGGCDQPFVLSDDPGTPPVPTVAAVLTDNGSDGTIAVTVTFDQDVTGFDETDMLISVLGVGTGIEANFIDIVVNSASSYTINYNANYGDGGGADITFSVPAASATGLVGGLDNVVSNDSVVTIPAS